MNQNVTVSEAARMLGKSQQFIREGLKSGKLPIGTAVKMSSKYTYHISRKRLEDYLGNIDDNN